MSKGGDHKCSPRLWSAGQAMRGNGLSAAFEDEQKEQLTRRSELLQEQRLGRAPAQGVSECRWKCFLALLQNGKSLSGDKAFQCQPQILSHMSAPYVLWLVESFSQTVAIS